MSTDPRVIVALDYDEPALALDFAGRVSPDICKLKIGKELFTVAGPSLVQKLADKGFQVFLDLKYHDIPVTVAKACKAAASLGVWMVNVHALGGPAMLTEAACALEGLPVRPKLIGVTVLTSMNEQQLRSVGIEAAPQDEVLRLACLAKECGLDGVVCSAQEAFMLAQKLGRGFLKVTPGIRPQGSSSDDQKRIMTPAQAIGAGSDYLVIGRPVTRAPDPIEALEKINLEVAQALACKVSS